MPQATKARIINRTRETLVATACEVASDSRARRKGLLGRDFLPSGSGLLITPCEGVHTIGMRFAIDILYLDRQHRVAKVRSSVKPWRLSLCLRAHSVLELPSGIAEQSGTKAGDQLEITFLQE